MKPHKWTKEIKAWADGAEIEWADIRYIANPTWYDCDKEKQPDWDTTFYKYRVKPQSKEPQYLYVYEDIGGINITSDKNYATKDMEYIGKIKLEDE